MRMRFIRKSKVLNIIVLIIFSMFLADSIIFATEYGKSNDDVIKSVELFQKEIEKRLNPHGFSNSKHTEDILNRVNSLKWGYSSYESWCSGIEIYEYDIFMSGCPIDGSYTISGLKLNEHDYEDINELTGTINNEDEMIKYWLIGEYLVNKYIGNEHIKIIRDTILDQKTTYYIMWEMYYDNYQLRPGGIDVVLYKDSNKYVLKYMNPIIEIKPVKLNQDDLFKKISGIADLMTLTRPNIKKYVYSQRNVLRSPRFFHAERQPIYQDTLKNHTYINMYEIRVIFVDREFDTTNKSIEEIYSSGAVKGDATYYVDQHSGRVFIEELFIDGELYTGGWE